MTDRFGAHYQDLTSLEQYTFSLIRGIDSTLKEDYVNAAAFFLESRQLSLLIQNGFLNENFHEMVSFILECFINYYHPKLSADKKIDGDIFMLHLEKIARNKRSLKIKDPMFLIKKPDDEISIIKANNPKIFGHSVYVSAQNATNMIVYFLSRSKDSLIKDLLKDINFKTLFDNIGFFESPDQKRDQYREAGQRLYLTIIARHTEHFERAYNLFLENKISGISLRGSSKNIFEILFKTLSDPQNSDLLAATLDRFKTVCCLYGIDFENLEHSVTSNRDINYPKTTAKLL